MTEGRDVLCLILADIDCPCDNGRFCRTACVSLYGHGDVRGKTDGVIVSVSFAMLSLLCSGHTSTMFNSRKTI